MQLLALIVLTFLVSALAMELHSKVLSDPPSPQEPVSQVLLAESAEGPAEVPQERQLPAVSALTETLQRPLFVPGRRVVKAPAPAPVAPPVAPEVSKPAPFAGQFNLSAVVLTSDGLSKAIIRNPKTGENEQLSPGDEIAGWTLVSVTKDGVRLQWNEQYEEVPLQVFDDATRKRNLQQSQLSQNNLPNSVRRRAAVIGERAQRPRALAEAERAARIRELRRQWRERNIGTGTGGGPKPARSQ